MRATPTRARRNGDDGFTLIELLIVIVILGVLAAIVVFSVQGINNQSSKASCQSVVAEVDTAYEAAVAQGTASAPTVTVASLASFFHNNAAPTTAGSNPISSTTTVANVDSFTC